MQQEIILKKNLLGGFNRKQVTQCLYNLKTECNNSASSEEIEAARKTIENCTALLSEKAAQIVALQEQLADIKQPETKDRVMIAKSISEAEHNISQAKIKADEITLNTRAEIEKRIQKTETLFSKIQNTIDEAQNIKHRLSKVMDKLTAIQLSDPDVSNVTTTELKPEPKVKIKTKEQPIVVAEEPTIIPETFAEETEFLMEDTQESVNSIDNFFEELYKMTNGKLFEPKKLPDTISNDDFEYEY